MKYDIVLRSIFKLRGRPYILKFYVRSIPRWIFYLIFFPWYILDLGMGLPVFVFPFGIFSISVWCCLFFFPWHIHDFEIDLLVLFDLVLPILIWGCLLCFFGIPELEEKFSWVFSVGIPGLEMGLSVFFLGVLFFYCFGWYLRSQDGFACFFFLWCWISVRVFRGCPHVFLAMNRLPRFFFKGKLPAEVFLDCRHR